MNAARYLHPNPFPGSALSAAQRHLEARWLGVAVSIFRCGPGRGFRGKVSKLALWHSWGTSAAVFVHGLPLGVVLMCQLGFILALVGHQAQMFVPSLD